jgi:hypothetical protein
MTDPVKAALRAGYSAINRETESAITAAEFSIGVEAFLRALRGCDLRTPEDGDMTMDELAAAVARAAKEATHGH